MQLRQRFQRLHLEFNRALFQQNTEPTSNSNENQTETEDEDDGFMQEVDE